LLGWATTRHQGREQLGGGRSVDTHIWQLLERSGACRSPTRRLASLQSDGRRCAERKLDVRVLASNEGLILQSVGQVRNRFMIDSTETDGRFGLLQHIFEPKALAAPMHRHHDEDEYTYVLSGRIGAVLGGQEVFGGPGDLIFKPRNQWHRPVNTRPPGMLRERRGGWLDAAGRSFD
jgi:mannose-6-phosphate isomerase-like protein (cupin superfamily)